ncbi:FAD-dependent oxidoreductase [Microbacterium gubbeenense]|uniref:flavin monoamine oxidase family protein n=1 Tax=Microbacterium gubbeenense TaxID=159896 RepID=UPI003F9E5163
MLLASCTPDSPPVPDPTKTRQPTVTPTPVGEVPAPKSFFRTSWAEDPFARGALSITPAGSTSTERQALAAALMERVFFAGEATSVERPGTIAGAVRSGERVAGEIADVAEDGERIAIVGAGAAGASAAARLIDAGFDVTVIEARDYAGGRLATQRDDDWPVPPQRGAWLLGADDTEVASRMALLGVGSVAVTDPVGFTTDGETENPSGDALKTAIAEARDGIADRTILEALEDAGVEQSPELAAVLSSLSAMTGVDPATASSWFAPALPGGSFDALVSDVAPFVDSVLGDLEVTLSTVVSHVSYDDSGVSLRLASGESLTFDRVALTVPLGVLQAGGIEFEPPLPFAHRGAISTLEMGHLESVWLRYETPFWSTDAGIWHIVGPVTPTPTPTPSPGEEPAPDTTIRTWINLLPATGEPILVGLVGGAAARVIAELGDDDVFTLAATSLAPFTEPAPSE